MTSVVDMRPLASHAIGIDIGGTKIAGGLVALDNGRILTSRRLSTRAERGSEAVLNDIVSMIKELLEVARSEELPVRGVGIGVAELVDRAGKIGSAHAIPWRGWDVAARLAHLAPTVVEADVRAHALAEARYGVGRAYDSFAFVTVGTGISSCLVIDGQPFAGARGNALVLASSPVTTTCTTCGTVLRPVLEDFASGPALVRRWNAVVGASATRGEDVLARAAEGNEVAVAVVSSAGEALGVAIGWLVNVLDPAAVIIGGGLGTAGGLYWDSLIAVAREHIWADATRDLPILPAALGAEAGLIGAAACVAC